MKFSKLNVDVKKWRDDWRRDTKAKEEGKEENGAAEVGFIKEPSPEMDLNGNDYEEFCDQKDRSTEWGCLESQVRCNIDIDKYDAVAGRGCLVDLGTALYADKSFKLDAVTLGHKKTIFLSPHKTPASQKEMYHYWAA